MRQSNFKSPKGWVLLAIATFFLPVALSNDAHSQCVGTFGDLNGSADANVVDVQCAILSTFYAMGGGQDASLIECLSGSIEEADTNCDGAVNVVDATLIISAAMTVPLSLMADYNGNDCPNLCDLDGTEVGSLEPLWELLDYQPESASMGETYGLAALEGVTVVSLLAAS